MLGWAMDARQWMRVQLYNYCSTSSRQLVSNLAHHIVSDITLCNESDHGTASNQGNGELSCSAVVENLDVGRQ